MKQKIVLIVAVVAGLLAALLTRTYLTSKDTEYRVLPIGRGCLWGGGSVLYVASCDMVAHKAQCLSYMRLMNLPLGLVINFGDYRLGKRGIARLILAGADAEEADF